MAEQTTQNISIHTEGKNIVIAYVIWFFLGTLGIHRIYLGRTGSGFTMLAIWVLSLILTFAFVGVLGFLVLAAWWLVDAFLIPGIVESANRNIVGTGGIRFVTESSQPKEDSMQQLERLHSLRQKGVLDEHEYESRKAKLLAE